MATCLWSISNKMWFEFLVKKSSSEFLNKQIKTTDAVNRLYVARLCHLGSVPCFRQWSVTAVQ